MKQLKNLIFASFLLAGLLLQPFCLGAQPKPIVELYLPLISHEGYLAPMVKLCDQASPCGYTSTVEATIHYDTIFDISSIIVHGFWFSPDSAADVDWVVDQIQKTVKVTLTRESPVQGGGTLFKLPGIGIVDPIPIKLLPAHDAADPAIGGFTVFPNPCTEQCYFRFDRNIEQVALVNTQGTILWQAHNLPPSEIALPTEGLPTGIYTLRLRAASTTFTSKIVLTTN